MCRSVRIASVAGGARDNLSGTGLKAHALDEVMGKVARNDAWVCCGILCCVAETIRDAVCNATTKSLGGATCDAEARVEMIDMGK